MAHPCLCNGSNENTASLASNPSNLGLGLMYAPVRAFGDTISVFADELRKGNFLGAATALGSFNTQQKRLVHFLFRNNPGPDVATLATHVNNVAKFSTAQDACDALASDYCVPRKSDLTLPLWYHMVPSTHVCG